MRILYIPNEYSQQRQNEKPANIYPVRMAMEATLHRNNGCEVAWGSPIGIHEKYDHVFYNPEYLPFLSLPAPDRVLTKAMAYTSGNYKYTPGTHMQAADGCWHGKCSFCVERKNKYVVRPIEDCIEEIYQCKQMGFKEVFDDSGTFPDGEWLMKFCITKRVTNELEKFPFSCNMRIGADCDFKTMKQSGFRMLLFGVESANQKTLDRLNKGVKAHEIIPYIKKASNAGLEPHLAVMLRYPWESEKEELKTLELVHYCLRKGYAKTAQASIYNVPGISDHSTKKPIPKDIYKAAWSAEFWYNKLKDIKSLSDLRYLFRGIKEGLK